MRRGMPWLIGTALIVAAGAVAAVTPPDSALTQEFVIGGAAGEAVTARTLTAQVHDAAFADRITTDDGLWGADGNWLVVTVIASAPQTEVDAAIRLATLSVGDRTFQASERPATSLQDADLRVGTDIVGMLAFELPADVEAGEAELRLITQYATPQLDDVIALPIDLDGLPSHPEIDIAAPTWAQS